MADDFQANSDAFMSWLVRSSVTLNSKIKLADLRAQNAGRGVVAAADIEQDEALFTIPRSAVLMVANSDLAGKIPEAMQGLDPWLSLILVMLYEHLRGCESHWKPYFDILPATFDTLMFWTPEELGELQASAVVHKIGKEQADASFQETLLPIVSKHAGVFFPASSRRPSNGELLEAMHRMGSLIMAYAFDIERDAPPTDMDEEGYASQEEDEALPKGMVALADMLNADADRNNARLFYEDAALVMKALKPIAAGEEIFNDYGPLPRSDLLRRYGYITPNYARYDVVEVPQALVLEAVAEETHASEADIESRLEYLDEEGVTDSGYDISRRGADETLLESISLELLTLVAALAMPHADFLRLKERGKLPKIGAIATPMARVLRRVVQKRISQYQTTAEDDERLLAEMREPQATDPGTRRRQMAIEVRLGEKKILMESESALTGLLEGEQNAGQTKKRKIE